jgi:hypothetical protein
MAAKTFRCFQCRGPVGDWEAVVVNFGKRGKVLAFHFTCLFDHLIDFYATTDAIKHSDSPTTGGPNDPF